MTRVEMRAHLRANDPHPDHWLKRANRLLEARLEANRIEHGWPAEPQFAPQPPAIESPPLPTPAPTSDVPRPDGFRGVDLA